MHEASLVESLIDQAAEVSGGEPVVTVTVRRGALCQVSVGSLEAHFAALAPGTVVAGAALEVVDGPQGDAALDDPYARDLLLVSLEVVGDS